MRSSLTVGIAATLMLASSASAGTRFKTTWKAPDVAALSFQGQKVAAMIVTPRESTRIEGEHYLANELIRRGVQGIPAFNLIPPNEPRDKERAKELFNAAGVAGVVVLRGVGGQTVSTESAGMGYWGSPYYGSFWGGGYYGYAWGAVADPGYLYSENKVWVEVLVYDLRADKLVWAGLSESTNPSGLNDLVKKLSSSAADQMKKQGLIRSR